MSADTNGSRIVESPPGWLWAATALWIAVALKPWLPAPAGGPLTGTPYLLFFAFKSAVECAAFLWAASRPELGPRLRQALRITAAAFCLSGVLSLAYLLNTLGVTAAMTSSVDNAATLLTYVLGLTGMLWMPMLPARHTAWWKFTLDLAAAVLGIGAVLTVLITMPSVLGANGEAAVRLALTYGCAQVLMLVGLNVLVLRAEARPSNRALWLFVTLVLGNLFTVVLAQFELATEPAAGTTPFSDAAALATSVCTLWAAVAFRRDPIAVGAPRPLRLWLESFNPLPLMATAAVALMLVFFAHVPASTNLRALAIIMVIQMALVLARLFLTSHENTRLLREQTEREVRAHVEKSAAIGRLAGGMAHWYNNLLTAVIGYAELGVDDAGANPAVRADFAAIGVAADRAARLTGQLLSYSGRDILSPSLMDLAAGVRTWCARAAKDLPSGVRLSVSAPGAAWVKADVRRFEAVVRELIDNAVSAMPSGGTIEFRVYGERLDAVLDPAVIPAGPGEFVVIEAKDNGTGIAREAQALIFDPFYSTKPMHAAVGLGLAFVYGAVAAHHGGLVLQSQAGTGTAIRVYLPRATDGPDTSV